MRDEVFFDRAVGRMRIAMLWLSVAGTVTAWIIQGWQWGLGFLAGALASLANFRWLHEMTASLGEGAPRPRKRLLVFLSLRYVLLGLAGYVIVRIFGLSLAAALLGLLVAVAAAILEALYELVYVRA